MVSSRFILLLFALVCCRYVVAQPFEKLNNDGQVILFGVKGEKNTTKTKIEYWNKNGDTSRVTTTVTENATDEVLNQVQRRYDQQGNLREARTWEKGKLIGYWREWKDGLLIKEAFYKEPGIISYEKEFYPLGDTIQLASYKKYSMDTIHKKEYHPNGSVRRISTRIDGKLQGSYREWYENGEVKVSANYHKNRPVGKVVHKYKNGKPKKEEYFILVNDSTIHLSGWKKEYYRDGTIERAAHYANNKRNGWARTYYSSGQVNRSIYFYDGECAGRWMEWHENGTLKILKFCEPEGRQWGPEIHWFENGTIRAIKFPTGGREITYHFDGKPRKLVDNHFHGQRGLEINWLPDGSVLSSHLIMNKQKVGEVPASQTKELYKFYDKLAQKNKNFQEIPSTGEWVLKYPGMKTPVLQFHTKDSLLNGSMTYANFDGQTLGSTTFDEEKFNGSILALHPNGDTLYYKEFNKGEPSLTITYHHNGNRQELNRYDQGHSVAWLRQTYYDNGVIKSIYELTHTELGKHSTFYRSGAKKHYGEFYDPRRIDPEFYHGARKECNTRMKWYERGNVEWIIEYNDQDSTQRERKFEFFESGDTSKLMEYAEGDYHGHYKEWYDGGTPKIKGWFVNGQRDGIWTFYTQSGAVDFTKHYKNGQLIAKKQEIRSCYCDHYNKSPQFVPKLYQIVDSATIDRHRIAAFASVEETASKLFFSGNPNHNNLNLISNRPMDVWFSNTSMFRLRLNPCRHTNSVSHTPVELLTMQNSGHPFELTLYPDTIEISVNANNYLPIGVERKPSGMQTEADRVKFLFKVSKITYDLKTVDLEDLEAVCIPEFHMPRAGLNVQYATEAVPVLIPRISVNWEEAMNMLDQVDAGPLKDSIFDRRLLGKQRSIYIKGGSLSVKGELLLYTGNLRLAVLFSGGIMGCISVKGEQKKKGLVDAMQFRKFRMIRSVEENGTHYIYFKYGLGI